MSNRYEVSVGRAIKLPMLYSMLKLYNEILTSDCHIGFFRGALLLRKTLNGYIVIYDKKTRRVAGIATILSLKDRFYEDFKEGKKSSNNLRPRDLNNLYKSKKGEIQHFYSGVIGVNPEVNDKLVVFRLLKEINVFLLSLAKQNIFGDVLIADVVSEEGQRLSELIGMKYLTANIDGSKMYSVSLMPFELSYKSGPYIELKSLYENKEI